MKKQLTAFTRTLPVKKRPSPGLCHYHRCGNKATGRKRWCDQHREFIRKVQLRINSRNYRKRWKGKNGERKEPHLLYRGRPSSWALKHPVEAIELARTNERLTVPFARFERLLAQGLRN